MLASFGSGARAVVIGASGGIGRAVVDQLAHEPNVARVHALSRSPVADLAAKVVDHPIDIEDESSIAAAARAIAGEGGVHLVLVATGILHADDGFGPEKDWRALDADDLARAFRINAIGPALVAKHFLPLLARDGKAVLAMMSARVGSIADNRLGGWYGYRASKAALNMMIRTLSVELARKRPQALCVGLHPGTVDTALSKPFQAGMSSGRPFTPAFAAERLLGVIDRLTPEDTGRVFAWDGQEIQP